MELLNQMACSQRFHGVPGHRLVTDPHPLPDVPRPRRLDGDIGVSVGVGAGECVNSFMRPAIIFVEFEIVTSARNAILGDPDALS
jgi:hypothetical protein